MCYLWHIADKLYIQTGCDMVVINYIIEVYRSWQLQHALFIPLTNVYTIPFTDFFYTLHVNTALKPLDSYQKRMNVESTSEYITSISNMTVKLEINLRPESRSVAPGPRDYPHNETCSQWLLDTPGGYQVLQRASIIFVLNI